MGRGESRARESRTGADILYGHTSPRGSEPIDSTRDITNLKDYLANCLQTKYATEVTAGEHNDGTRDFITFSHSIPTEKYADTNVFDPEPLPFVVEAELSIEETADAVIITESYCDDPEDFAREPALAEPIRQWREQLAEALQDYASGQNKTLQGITAL